VLQADEDKVHERARGGLLAVLFTRNQALVMIGNESEGPDSDVLYIPNIVTPTELDNLIPPTPLPGAVPVPPPALSEAQQAELLPRDTRPGSHGNGMSRTPDGDNRDISKSVAYIVGMGAD